MKVPEGSGATSEATEARQETARLALCEAATSHSSVDGFVPALYGELRGMARGQLRGERPDHTLSTTALVHEAYLKLAKLDRIQWQNRAHFCAEAARAMRRTLVNHAVRRGTKKRGGGLQQVELDNVFSITDVEAAQLISLHQALARLEAHQPEHARVVECRFFAGMTIDEISEALGVSPATVKRRWQLARAWLASEL